MKATIGKKFTFEAAHFIPWHVNPDGTPGKCSAMHGHSYHGIAYLTGTVDERGWVKDFYLLGKEIASVTSERFDHRTLNDIHPFGPEHAPTTENVAAHILRRLVAIDPRYSCVKIEETDTSVVLVEREDL